jgi:hypothetical protein
MSKPQDAPKQEKIKIIFEVTGIGVFSEKEPLTGDIDTCTEEGKKQMKDVLTWEGSMAKIQIQDQSGSAINVEKIKPLSHFDPDVEYYYINDRFVPTDTNGLEIFIDHLNGAIGESVSQEQQNYMKVIHTIVDKILNSQDRPNEAIGAKIFDGKASIQESHNALNGQFNDAEKCNNYLNALKRVLEAVSPVDQTAANGAALYTNRQPQTQPQQQPQQPTPPARAAASTVTQNGKNNGKEGGNRTRRFQTKKYNKTRRHDFQ